jgi:predicted DNA-binding transcriptional regulator AlpA
MRRVYRLPDLRDLGISYSDVHLRRLEEAGTFPKRFKLNPGSGPQGAVGWAAPAIDRHIDALISAPDAA